MSAPSPLSARALRRAQAFEQALATPALVAQTGQAQGVLTQALEARGWRVRAEPTAFAHDERSHRHETRLGLRDAENTEVLLRIRQTLFESGFIHLDALLFCPQADAPGLRGVWRLRTEEALDSWERAPELAAHVQSLLLEFGLPERGPWLLRAGRLALDIDERLRP